MEGVTSVLNPEHAHKKAVHAEHHAAPNEDG